MNQCANFFAKLGASPDADFMSHAFPPESIGDLIINDAIGTFFPRK
jgi:hypothetical protein